MHFSLWPMSKEANIPQNILSQMSPRGSLILEDFQQPSKYIFLQLVYLNLTSATTSSGNNIKVLPLDSPLRYFLDMDLSHACCSELSQLLYSLLYCLAHMVIKAEQAGLKLTTNIHRITQKHLKGRNTCARMSAVHGLEHFYYRNISVAKT